MFKKVALFLIGLCLFTSVVHAENLSKLTEETIFKLEKIGFVATNILQKTSTDGGLHFTLLRCRSQKRVFDISIFSKQQAYLSVSYDGGKRFGKVSRFNQLKTLLELVEKIEKREKKRQLDKTPTSTTKTTDNQQATDQRLGLEEAKQQAVKDKANKQANPAKELSSIADSVAPAASGGGAGDNNNKFANSAAVDQKLDNFSGKFSGGINPCATSSSTSNSSSTTAAGGLANLAKQLGEATIAVAVAEAFAMRSSSLADISTLDTADSSKYFSTFGNEDSLAKYLQEKNKFSKSTIDQKTNLLKALLTSIILEKDIELAREYRSIKDLFLRFKTWGTERRYCCTI